MQPVGNLEFVVLLKSLVREEYALESRQVRCASTANEQHPLATAHG